CGRVGADVGAFGMGDGQDRGPAAAGDHPAARAGRPRRAGRPHLAAGRGREAVAGGGARTGGPLVREDAPGGGSGLAGPERGASGREARGFPMPEGELGVRGTAWSPETRLYADGVVLGARGEPVTVPPHSAAERVPGTGLAGPEDAPPGAAAAAPDAVAEERAALARACLPGIGTRWEGMARTALVDIRTLMFRGGAADGAMVAASSPHWRYVWPRDASYCAVALHLCGLGDEAARVLDYLARVLPRDRPWDARYLPDGSGRVPDARPVQLDGAGWVLWAVWHWAGGAARRATVEGGGGRRAKRAVAVAGEPAWRRIEPLARAALAIV